MADSGGPLAVELGAAAALITGRFLDAEYAPERDPQYAETVEAMLGSDLD